MKKVFYYETDIGKVGVGEDGTALTNFYFSEEEIPHDAVLEETNLLKEAGKQLQEYFAGKRKVFQLPFAPEGTEFQQRVWKALQDIPYGETRSYKQVAEAIGNPKACRAVGMANNRNPLALFIPCHRVIGANGKLVGYGGGLDVKVCLLKLEKDHANS